MKGKVLIVEDSLTIQRVFELAFLRSGYQVTYIDRGEDLKSMAQELKPELIICDLTLPDIDGYQAVSELKKETLLSSIPVLLLAGSIEPFDEDLFKSSGADGVIFKPFDSQELLDKVEELLRDKVQVAERDEREPREMAEEGWDFSDVFDEVEIGISGGEETDSEEPFITELVAESDLPDVERVEDYDIGVEELGKEEIHEVKELERMQALGEEEAEGDEIERDVLDELIDDLEMEVRQEIDDAEIGEPEEQTDDMEMEVKGGLGDEEEIILGADESPDVEMDDVFGAELTDTDAPPSETAEIGLEGAAVEDTLSLEGEQDQAMKMNEEDKMMEEIVRDVDDFPISSGYDITSHGILKKETPRREGTADKGGEYEETLRKTFSSDEFRNSLRGLVAEITEKILWEVLPGIMEDLKGDIVSVIKEVSASVVPEVADRIIQEEVNRIKEEIGHTD